MRKQKPPSTITTSNIDTAEAAATNSIVIKPVGISLDDTSGVDVDDIHRDEAQLVNRTVADWTLHSAAQQSQLQHDDQSSEGQSQGTIDSSSEHPSEASISHQQHVMTNIPDGYHPVSLDELSTTDTNTTTLSSPLVMINLEKLCGYTPDVEERRVIITQLTATLYGSDSTNDNDDADANLGVDNGNDDGLEFDTRIVELFESGVGSHVDSECDIVNQIQSLDNEEAIDDAVDNKTADHPSLDKLENTTKNKVEEEEVRSLAIIPYPEFLRDQYTLKSTTRLWKLIHTPHPLPVIQRLFTHLINTSRSLLWKVEMHNQIRLLVMEEYDFMCRRKAREEYGEWKKVRRERLEKLYEVRETFLLRVDVARDRYDKLVEEREQKVNIEMTRRRGNVWIETKKKESRTARREEISDEQSDLFDVHQCHDDDGWGGVVIPEEDIIGDADDNNFHINTIVQCDNDDSDSESNEEWSPVGMSVVVQDKNEESTKDNIVTKRPFRSKETINKLEPITTDDNIQRKSKRLEKATASQTDSHKAMAEEERMVREKLKTTDELMAEAMLRNLQKRLDEVDTLLETIQEEEWAEEEDDDNDDEQPHDLSTAEETTDNSHEMTLLDQILAMILGALPMIYSGASTEEQHFWFVKEEHRNIVNEWKETFGRLPTANEAASDKKQLSVEELRAMGNDNKAWDEVDW